MLLNMYFSTCRNALTATLLLLSAPHVAAEDRTIEMTGDLRFVPESLTIQAGDTVTWQNVSELPHTVTADPAEAQDGNHVSLPESAETFNSGIIQAGESWSRTFDVPGEYTYFCIPHEGAGMVASLTVE